MSEIRDGERTVSLAWLGGNAEVNAYSVRRGGLVLAIAELALAGMDILTLAPKSGLFVDADGPLEHARCYQTSETPRARTDGVVEAVQDAGLWYAILWTGIEDEEDREALGIDIVPVLLARKGFETPARALALCDAIGTGLTTVDVVRFLALTRGVSEKYHETIGNGLDGVMPRHAVTELDVIEGATFVHGYGSYAEPDLDWDNVELFGATEVRCPEDHRVLWPQQPTGDDALVRSDWRDRSLRLAEWLMTEEGLPDTARAIAPFLKTAVREAPPIAEPGYERYAYMAVRHRLQELRREIDSVLHDLEAAATSAS